MNQTQQSHDIFLSYARDNRAVAGKIADRLKEQGFTVWWDSDILPGAQFVDSIETGLRSAACVVVIWSQKSVQSRYVRNEAEYGANKGKLVPLMIEEVEIPWEVSNFQTLDFIQWAKDGNDDDFSKLVEGLRVQLEKPAGGAGASSGPRPKPAPPSRGKGPKKPARRMIVLAAMAVLAFGTWLQFGQSMFNPGAPDTIAEIEFSHTPLTGNGKTLSSHLSPDGNLLAFTHNNNGRYSLRLKQIKTGSENILVPEDQQGIRSPVFSPDGTMVFFAMTGPEYSLSPLAVYDLYRIPILGGVPQKIIDQIIGLRFVCSPDGQEIVFKKAAGDSIFTMTSKTDGSDQRRIYASKKDISVRCNLAWSADGTEVFTTEKAAASGQLKIIAIPVAGGPIRDIAGGTWQAVMDFASMDDGSGLLVAGCPSGEGKHRNLNIWYQPLNASDPESITNDLLFYYQVSSDKSGSKLALNYYATKRILRVLDISAPEKYLDVSAEVVPNGKVAWGGPGRLLANQQVGERMGLVKIQADGSAITPVVSNEEYISQMATSPDGRHLAYTSYSGPDFTIYLADGQGNAPRRISEEKGKEQYPIFSPDSQWLYYCFRGLSETSYSLMRYSIANRTTTELSDHPAIEPRISPDGSQVLAFFRDQEKGDYRPGLIPSGGGIPIYFDLPGAFEILSWNPQGDGFTCFNTDGSTPNLWNVSQSGEEPVQLTDFPPGHKGITGFSWNAAGDSLAVALEATTFDSVLLEASSP